MTAATKASAPTTTDARRTGCAASFCSARFLTTTPTHATVAATATPNGIAATDAKATDPQLT
ncbi:hypothetical protein GA0004736_3656 [Curtobacterium sp. 9128]|nr:hypothetical protein GA0004736_3656 [Curtobacterium sp. 9128]